MQGKRRIFVFWWMKSKEAHRVWQVMSLGVTTEHLGQCLLSWDRSAHWKKDRRRAQARDGHLGRTPRAHSERRGDEGTAGASGAAWRARAARQAADGEAPGTWHSVLYGRRRRLDGGTFQAKRDTGQPPSHADWTCFATTGRDAKSLVVRGRFDQSASYRRLDVVALNGGSFVALKDAPGPCPGPGWQLIASQGKRGAAGEKGERGSPGPRGDAGASGATILGWKIDRERYVATPVMTDGGEGPPLELRGLFEQFLHETR
jgi:hypothetical protein